MSHPPWNDWYHVTGSTYGAWLRGDPRGWRARHHREHVEGDYRHPPPAGLYENLYAQSRALMRRDAVVLSPDARTLACEIWVRSLQFHEVDVVAIAIGAMHYHLLARFRDHDPRKWIGLAKTRSARAISESGLGPSGGIWAVRCRSWPIKDRAHQVATARYIARHSASNAAIWVHRPLGKPSTPRRAL